MRYVVIGPQREPPSGESSSQGLPGIRSRDGRAASRSQTNITFDGTTYLSVYKGPVRVAILLHLHIAVWRETTDQACAG